MGGIAGGGQAFGAAPQIGGRMLAPGGFGSWRAQAHQPGTPAPGPMFGGGAHNQMAPMPGGARQFGFGAPAMHGGAAFGNPASFFGGGGYQPNANINENAGPTGGNSSIFDRQS